MPRSPKKRKAALDARMRDDVYRRSVEIIEAEGPAALTPDRLSKAIGVSRATLGDYFDDRDAVVHYVEERTFAPLLDSLESIADGDASPAAKLEAVAVEIFEEVHENRALVVALSSEKQTRAVGAHRFERRRHTLDIVQRVLEEGVRVGQFRKLPADDVAQVFVGAIYGFVDTMIHSGEFRAPDDVIPTILKTLLGGLQVS